MPAKTYEEMLAQNRERCRRYRERDRLHYREVKRNWWAKRNAATKTGGSKPGNNQPCEFFELFPNDEEREMKEAQNQPGRFAMIDKSQIKIDHAYQRENINEARIARIAADFCWLKFGVLIIVVRNNGVHYCVDGQHRLLGAMENASVTKVPCLIFGVSNRVQEAKGFLGPNSDRSSVQMFDKINALVTSEDDVAVFVKRMVEASGYTLSKNHGQRRVTCVTAIYNAARSDKQAAQMAWLTCVDLYQGDTPRDDIFKGLFTLEKALNRSTPNRSLRDNDNLSLLLKAGHMKLRNAVHDNILTRRSGGPRVCAEGIANVINKGRRSGRVPSMSPASGDE